MHRERAETELLGSNPMRADFYSWSCKSIQQPYESSQQKWSTKRVLPLLQASISEMETFSYRTMAAISFPLLGYMLWYFIQNLSLWLTAFALEELDGAGHLAVATVAHTVLRLPHGKCLGILFWGLF